MIKNRLYINLKEELSNIENDRVKTGKTFKKKLVMSFSLYKNIEIDFTDMDTPTLAFRELVFGDTAELFGATNLLNKLILTDRYSTEIIDSVVRVIEDRIDYEKNSNSYLNSSNKFVTISEDLCKESGIFTRTKALEVGFNVMVQIVISKNGVLIRENTHMANNSIIKLDCNEMPTVIARDLGLEDELEALGY